MAQPQGFSHEPSRAGPFRPHATVIGGGTLPGGAWTRSAWAKAVIAGGVVGLVLRGSGAPRFETARRAGSLGPFARSPKRAARWCSASAMSLRSMFSRRAHAISRGGLSVLALIAESAEHRSSRNFWYAAFAASIPARKAVVVTDEAPPGMFMSFAVCDATAARAELSMARCASSRDKWPAPRRSSGSS